MPRCLAVMRAKLSSPHIHTSSHTQVHSLTLSLSHTNTHTLTSSTHTEQVESFKRGQAELDPVAAAVHADEGVAGPSSAKKKGKKSKVRFVCSSCSEHVHCIQCSLK